MLFKLYIYVHPASHAIHIVVEHGTAMFFFCFTLATGLPVWIEYPNNSQQNRWRLIHRVATRAPISIPLVEHAKAFRSIRRKGTRPPPSPTVLSPRSTFCETTFHRLQEATWLNSHCIGRFAFWLETRSHFVFMGKRLPAVCLPMSALCCIIVFLQRGKWERSTAAGEKKWRENNTLGERWGVGRRFE